jgi:hypothetical protein
MSDNDGGLPEESQNKQEIANAVTTNPRALWKVDGRSVAQNYDDLIEFGFDVFSAATTKSPTTKVVTVIVLDNESYTQHYPNNKQFWMGAYTKGQEDAGLIWKPFTEFFIGLRDAGNPNVQNIIQNSFIGRYKGIQIDTYQGVPIVVPDPNIDHTRPIVQAEATTSTTTGVTVITKTTADPRAAGVVTESETVPAAVTTPTELTAEQRKWLGNADPTDPFILARMRAATGSAAGGFTVINPNLAAAVKATTGVAPCLPNNPPVSQGAGSGFNIPASVSAATSELKKAVAAAAAPVSKLANAAAATADGNAGEAAAQAYQAAKQTAPTTITQQPSTPTSASSNQSAANSANGNYSAPAASTPNVYVYEPIKPGFDRYDVNSGKKVFTPNSGPSRNALGQAVSPQSTPRVSPTANNAQQQSGPF